VTNCPVCGAESHAPFLVRDPVPVHQNLLVRTETDARALNRGRLALHACPSCGFVFNAAFDFDLLNYSAAYENTQSASPAFAAYVEDLAAHVVNDCGVRGSQIVEIGCGKGAFLRALVRNDPGNRGIGFDPSYVGPDEELDGRLRFEKRFYDERDAGLDADAIVCRHVIEHVPDPCSLLRLVRRTLGSRLAKVFFETPCVEWILSNEVTWDFFYEHCSYFTADSLTTAFTAAGFEVYSVRRTFGDQYLWIEAHPAAGEVAPVKRLAELRGQLEQLSSTGPLAMWGAGAKGVTLANLVDPDRRLLTCVVDLNPAKQGGYLPGTGHPIVGPLDMPRLGVRTAVLTNPNYLDENTRLLREAGLDVRLVNLMHSEVSDAHSH
jgi:hypothetical protein